METKISPPLHPAKKKILGFPTKPQTIAAQKLTSSPPKKNMPNIRPFSLTTLETPRIIFCFIEYVKSPRVIKIFLTKKSRRKNFKPKKFFDHPRHLKSGVPSPPVISNKTPKHPCTKINPLPPQKNMPNIRAFSLTTLETPWIIFCFTEYVKSPRVIKIVLTKKSRKKNSNPKNSSITLVT